MGTRGRGCRFRAHIVRVHNVRAMVDVVRVADRIRAGGGADWWSRITAPKGVMAKNSIRAALLALVLLHAPPATALSIEVIQVTPARMRAQPGDVIELRVRGAQPPTGAVLVTPGAGAQPLPIEAAASGEQHLRFTLPADGSPGLYLIHVWRGDRDRPTAIGKAAVLSGQVVMDFFLPAYLDGADPLGDLAAYLDDFRSIGGNTLIAHALITPDRAYFPSTIARNSVERGSPSDVIDQLLDEADGRGLAVFLSVSWDMTHPAPYRNRMRQITALMDELFALYGRHPSLAGFYSYQEGSGTYYVPYVREFTEHVKRLSPGLLSACAPFVDDPLVAGYLSTVDSLDVMIFQGQVMGSYRTDNRKRYPLRRVRDFAALGIGAKWLQDKFAITHVELFGYLENRPDPSVIAASYDNIFGQIGSVATAPGADGIALFAYHPHIWSARRQRAVQTSRRAVVDGLELFKRTQRAIGKSRNPLTVYFPYSDWIVERWTNSFLPALDGFRRTGIPVDILPYAPPLEESVYPYFPFHMNPAVLERLLAEHRVLVLPDVSGFQQTDSDLIDAFVQRGGVIVAFGPQIPMGRTFERDELFGARESDREAVTKGLRAPHSFGTRTRSTCTLPPARRRGWNATTARTLATFDDGSPAILANRHGAGLAIVVVPSIPDLAGGCGAYLREVLDYALTHTGQRLLADVEGLSEASDLSISADAEKLAVTIINHASASITAIVRPRDGTATWFDTATGRPLDASADGALPLEVPANGARTVERRSGARRHP